MLKVSIIIPVFNAERTIEKTIRSCIEQSYINLEVIIIDDGSTDNSSSVIKSINDNRIKYYYYKNSGRSIARNRGLSLAKGEYIQFLDSDDTLEKDKIQKAMDILQRDSSIDAVYCGTTYLKDNKIVSTLKAKPIKDVSKVLLRENIFPIHSVIFKAKLAKRFPEHLSYCEDWYFWVNTLSDARITAQPDYYGANVSIHEDNTMTNYSKMLLGEIYILFRIKVETSNYSTIRDLKIIKQLVNYCIKYDIKDIYKLDLPFWDIYPFYKLLLNFIKNKTISNILLKLLTLKQCVRKRRQLY